MNPEITVLISVKNGEPYIYSAVESVLSQSCENFELLILDNASTDNSIEIIRSFNDSRIRVIENSMDLGLSLSLNKGLSLSKGEYISRIDADDIMYPQRLEKQLLFLSQNPKISVVGSYCHIIDDNGVNTGKIKYPLGQTGNLESVIRGNNPVGHPLVMYRKNEIINSNSYEQQYRYGQDLNLWFGLYLRGNRCDNIPEYLSAYRIHNEQESDRKSEQKFKAEHHDIFEKFCNSFLSTPFSGETIRKYLLYHTWKEKEKSGLSPEEGESLFHVVYINFINRVLKKSTG
jgi:glycosyltransferase involved in cell wall biosynthesis